MQAVVIRAAGDTKLAGALESAAAQQVIDRQEAEIHYLRERLELLEWDRDRRNAVLMDDIRSRMAKKSLGERVRERAAAFMRLLIVKED